MRVGVLAQRTGVSQRLLRYYEEQGLLRPARLPNGYREYAESDIIAVSHIRTLLAAGLPTAVIAQVLDCVHDDDRGRLVPSACPGMVDHLHQQRARIADTIAQLRTAQDALETMLGALPVSSEQRTHRELRRPAANFARVPHADALHDGTRAHVVPGGTRHHGSHAEDIERERQPGAADLSRVAAPPELTP